MPNLGKAGHVCGVALEVVAKLMALRYHSSRMHLIKGDTFLTYRWAWSWCRDVPEEVAYMAAML